MFLTSLDGIISSIFYKSTYTTNTNPKQLDSSITK